MSFTGIWEQYNPHILHWLIVRELVQLEIIRFRAVYLTALFFLLNQMLSLRIVTLCDKNEKMTFFVTTSGNLGKMKDMPCFSGGI